MKKPQDVFYLTPEQALKEESWTEGVLQDDPASNLSPVIDDKESASLAESISSPLPRGLATSSNLRQHLDQLAGLIANITEAYSVVLFLADESAMSLRVGGVHTLSRDFLYDSRISFGSGLVGWTAENAVRISVCPFEHDATTLRYYGSDQDLKSFIAVPIIDQDEKLLGVISCDSKKSYAFAKITEKILLDCAVQAATLIGLLRKEEKESTPNRTPEKDSLSRVLERLREVEDENELLSTAAKLPVDLVRRDALVVMTTSEGGVGAGTFYSTSTETRIENRLLELVCRHKKVICSERSVHALSFDDIKRRSFLSVPIHVLGIEAGSLNLLSKPHDAFSAPEITALEKTAKTLGQCLELIRLRDKLGDSSETSGLLSWKHFLLQGKHRLAEAKKKKTPTSLIRMSFNNIVDVERFAGVDVASSLMARIMRLVGQVARQPSISCHLYGFQILILTESSEADKIMLRLRRLIERLSVADFLKEISHPSVNLGELISKGLDVASASYPRNGSSITELAANTRSLIEASQSKPPIGEVANAGNW